MDSHFIARDAAAVKEWLSTSYPCHVMRDHSYHGRVIMGGMWGVRHPARKREGWESMWRSVIGEPGGHGSDQNTLEVH